MSDISLINRYTLNGNCVPIRIQVKSYNGRNRFVLPFIVGIPYYIWIGCSRSRDTSRFSHAFEVEGGNSIGNCSPVNGPTMPALSSSMPDLDLGLALLESVDTRNDTVSGVMQLSSGDSGINSGTSVNVAPPLR